VSARELAVLIAADCAAGGMKKGERGNDDGNE